MNRYVAIMLTGAALAATPALAQQTQLPTSNPMGTTGTPGASTSGASTAGAAQVTAGMQVKDTSGGMVGTVDSVANGTATVNTGTTKVGVPVGSFAQQNGALVLGMTKTQLEAAVAKAQPAEIAVGTQVKGPQGGSVGTVAAVSGDLVTVQTAKNKVQLPKSAFAQAPGGGLVIGMTADQLDAAAAKASGKTGG